MRAVNRSPVIEFITFGRLNEVASLVITNNIPYLVYNICNSLNVLILISYKRIVEALKGRSSSPVGCGIGIAEVVGSNPTRSTFHSILHKR